MATYKLIQDIEAEDKILGPLTLRQFIFAIIAVFFGWICFISATKGTPFLLTVFLPPTLFFTFFAFPFGKDQPTELWALAKLNYWFRPRKRVWNQSGVKELVTITVPKKVEHVYTNGLSQTEVQSRLQALANTIDSRGWAIKNVNVNTYTAPQLADGDSDRLIEMSNLPRDVPAYQVAAADDILDEVNNPVAQKFDAMINQASRQHRQQLVNQLNTAVPAGTGMVTAQPASGAAEPWFLNPSQPVAAPEPIHQTAAERAAERAAEASLSAQLKAQANTGHEASDNLRTLRPLQTNQAAAPSPPPATPTPASSLPAMTTLTDPAILSLAKNNDLNVATLARQANKARHPGLPAAQDEVVISLH